MEECGLRNKQECSEDSSYDSDCELSHHHYDVSRTVSDTLGQEFAEYVDSGYLNRLEFAKKLGYTESQVVQALGKLGPNPSNNELLSELILLDNSAGAATIAPATDDHKVQKEETAHSVPQLRHVIIDGSNVAMSHGDNKAFSSEGIISTVEYFKSRNHQQITVFIPDYRKEQMDSAVMTQLEGIITYTPSRTVNGRRLVCYDDRYILKLAVETDGVVVSNDNYRDLAIESSEFKKVIESRLVGYSFVNGRFMPADDPYGRNGPSLSQILSKTPVDPQRPPCPYGRKCTYGSKCKYYHHTQIKSITETLRKQAMKTQSVPLMQQAKQQPVSRTRSDAASSFVKTTPTTPTQTPQLRTHKKLQRQLSINPVSDPRIINYDPFPHQPGLSSVWQPIQQEESERDRIFYHLKAIFPEHQVRTVMDDMKDCCDASSICSEIVKRFQKL